MPDGPGDSGASPAQPEKRTVARRSVVSKYLVVVLALVVTAGVVWVGIARSNRGRPATAPTSSVPPSTAVSTDVFVPPANPMRAITVSGNEILRNGKRWWLVGYNSFSWSGNCGTPAELMTAEQVDEWFASMRHDGHGAVRLMFFRNWNLSRLDAALKAAQRNNIYVTVTLGNGNPDCGEDNKDEAWFANDDDRASYAAHLTMLVSRYRGYGTIAWFEYFNEPQYAGGALRTFYDQMGSLAKKLDPTRLFSSGTLAPYALGGNSNYLKINESPGVDIASLHEYDYSEAETHLGPAARSNSAGKPVIVGEFGVVDPGEDRDGCLADVAKRAARVQRKVTAYASIPGYAGAFAWSWQPGSTIGVCAAPGVDRDADIQSVLRSAAVP